MMKKIIHPLENFEVKVCRVKWHMGFNIWVFTLFFPHASLQLNREHLKYCRNVHTVMTNHSQDTDMQTSLIFPRLNGIFLATQWVSLNISGVQGFGFYKRSKMSTSLLTDIKFTLSKYLRQKWIYSCLQKE